MASNFAYIASENKTNKEQSTVFLASGTQEFETLVILICVWNTICCLEWSNFMLLLHLPILFVKFYEIVVFWFGEGRRCVIITFHSRNLYLIIQGSIWGAGHMLLAGWKCTRSLQKNFGKKITLSSKIWDWFLNLTNYGRPGHVPLCITLSFNIVGITSHLLVPGI